MSTIKMKFMTSLQGLVGLERITGECTGKAIKMYFNDNPLKISGCRGECYDENANMLSCKKQLTH